jgi:hypothetical protein
MISCRDVKRFSRFNSTLSRESLSVATDSCFSGLASLKLYPRQALQGSRMIAGGFSVTPAVPPSRLPVKLKRAPSLWRQKATEQTPLADDPSSKDTNPIGIEVTGVLNLMPVSPDRADLILSDGPRVFNCTPVGFSELDLPPRNASLDVRCVRQMGVLNRFRTELPDHLLAFSFGLLSHVLLVKLDDTVEIFRAIRDLIVHLPRDPGAGLAEVGDDRERTKLFAAVPVEPDPPTRQVDRLKSIVRHLVALGCSTTHEALQAATSSFLVLE